MALTDQTIILGREKINELKQESDSLSEVVTTIKSSLANDSNYQVFATKVQTGSKINAAINEILNIFSSNINPNISSIVTKTNEFLDDQERENKR